VTVHVCAVSALIGGFAPAESGQHFTMDTKSEAPSVAEILADIAFPAEKWQITTCADVYGADNSTRRALYSLPPKNYTSADEVREALDEVQ
jgi:hypothetical protein